MDEQEEVRYVLTEKGMRFLAEQAGTPRAVFSRRGRVTRPGTNRDRGAPQRHRAHTIGVNRFMARLARDLRRQGGRLVEWRNEAESSCQFHDEHGRSAWIRPDGSGLLELAGERLAVLLEYDRGTLDAGDYRAKLAGFRRYYQGGVWRGAFPSEPVLLFVCADARAEYRVGRILGGQAKDLPVLITSEWRFVLDPAAAGVLGLIWWRPDKPGELCTLLDAGRSTRDE